MGDENEDEDSEKLLFNLFGTTDPQHMSIIPSVQRENDEDEEDEDDEWLDRELEKLENIRNMLLESTFNLYVCRSSMLSLYRVISILFLFFFENTRQTSRSRSVAVLWQCIL